MYTGSQEEQLSAKERLSISYLMCLANFTPIVINIWERRDVPTTREDENSTPSRSPSLTAGVEGDILADIQSIFALGHTTFHLKQQKE